MGRPRQLRKRETARKSTGGGFTPRLSALPTPTPTSNPTPIWTPLPQMPVAGLTPTANEASALLASLSQRLVALKSTSGRRRNQNLGPRPSSAAVREAAQSLSNALEAAARLPSLSAQSTTLTLSAPSSSPSAPTAPTISSVPSEPITSIFPPAPATTTSENVTTTTQPPLDEAVAGHSRWFIENPSESSAALLPEQADPNPNPPQSSLPPQPTRQQLKIAFAQLQAVRSLVISSGHVTMSDFSHLNGVEHLLLKIYRGVKSQQRERRREENNSGAQGS